MLPVVFFLSISEFIHYERIMSNNLFSPNLGTKAMLYTVVVDKEG
jgi:hypothetical protein